MPVNPKDAWNAAYTQLEMQLDRASFDTWLRDAVLLKCEGDVFVIGVRNGYARDMLQHRLYRNVRRILSDIYGQSVELRFEVRRSETAKSEMPPQAEMPLFRLLAQQESHEEPPAPLHQQVARPQRPDLPECELNPRYTFDRFVVGAENPMVYPAARAVAERPGMAYNPFMIYGGVGLGKTHLLQAIAHECRARGLRVIYISSEAFTNDLIDAIRQRTTAMFREKYRSADVLLVDDIQFIAGKDNTQEEFFHTFNALHMFNKQIVLAADRHPSQLEGVVDRLRSRFQSGLLADVQIPEFETRVAILRMWAGERGIHLPAAVCEALANRARTNIRELESVFNQVVAMAQLSRQPLDVETVEAALDGYRKPRNHVTLAQVLDITARHHGLSVEDLIGPRRNGPLNQARQIAMYLAREVTGASLPQIGEAFGGRKHSTVLHHCNKIANDLAEDELLRNVVSTLRDRLCTGDC
nr:MAG: chromosomal replication initiator protein DnaA [Chloroflexota bacterium]